MSGDVFVREAREDVRYLSEGLIRLEREGAGTVDELFRTAHSLKGTLGMEGYTRASELAHAIEDLLDAVRGGDRPPEGAVIDRGLDATDTLETMIDEIERHGEPVTDPTPAVEALRAAVAEGTADAEAAPGGSTGSQSSADPDSGGSSSEPTAEGAEEPMADETVAEALDAASEFDDLDALMEQMDDEESIDDLDGGGSFDDLGLGSETEAEPDRAGTDADPDPESDDDSPPGRPSEGRDVGTSDEFIWVNQEVNDEVAVTELQSEIETESFGEFDEEDDMTIQELIALEPDEPGADGPAEAAEAGGQAESAGPAETAEPGPTGSTAASQPEEPAAGGADPAEEPTVSSDSGSDEGVASTDSTGEAGGVSAGTGGDGGGGEPAGSATGGTDSTPDRAAGEDQPLYRNAGDAGEGGSTGSPADAADASGGPAPAGTAETDGEAGGADDEETEALHEVFDALVGDTDDRSDAADASGETGVGTDDGDTPDDMATADESPDDRTGDTDAEKTARTPAEAWAEETEPPGTAGTASTSDTGSGVTADETAGNKPLATGSATDTGSGGDDAPGAESAVGGEPEGASVTDDPAAGGSAEPEPPDLSGVDLSLEGDETETFEMDSGLADFESRFGELFEEESEEQPVEVAATIEDSALPTGQFRAAEDTDLPPERRTGEVSSLTVDVDYADELLALSEQLSRQSQRLTAEAAGDLRETAESLAAVTRDLRRTVMEVRLMPLETVTGGLSRVVRDVTRETGTQADLVVEGQDVEVDRDIIDRIRDPIVHLVRNAVDHGIEPPAEREAAGKPPTGTVALRARQEGDDVVIEIEDDGRGIEVDAVREAAVEKGIVDAAEARSLSGDEVIDLLFHPGMSTNATVTETSGRGVGMDVVRQTVAALNGSVTVETEPGAGTLIRLRLPVSVAVAEVLLVEAGGERFAVPAESVERVTPAAAAEDGGLVVGGPDRTVGLAEAMALSPAPAGGEQRGAEEGTLVHVDRPEGRLGVSVDRVIDRREVVITPYDDLLAGVPGLSGTTTDEDGRLIHVLNTEEL